MTSLALRWPRAKTIEHVRRTVCSRCESDARSGGEEEERDRRSIEMLRRLMAPFLWRESGPVLTIKVFVQWRDVVGECAAWSLENKGIWGRLVSLDARGRNGCCPC